MLRHCSDARYVWNLAVEQHSRWRQGRKSAPGVDNFFDGHCGRPTWRKAGQDEGFRITGTNADVNAARNIAAGHAVNARGGDRGAGPANREPQLALLKV